MGRCHKETDRDAAWGDTGWSGWVGELDWEVGEGEVGERWRGMLDGEAGGKLGAD